MRLERKTSQSGVTSKNHTTDRQRDRREEKRERGKERRREGREGEKKGKGGKGRKKEGRKERREGRNKEGRQASAKPILAFTSGIKLWSGAGEEKLITGGGNKKTHQVPWLYKDQCIMTEGHQNLLLHKIPL